MDELKFNKELYSKTALIKAAYNFTDMAYVHLDTDEKYFYVLIEPKDKTQSISEQEFMNEMLAQSVRHEIYSQTKNIRELLLARAMATSVVVNDDEMQISEGDALDEFSEDEILKDWFANDEKD